MKVHALHDWDVTPREAVALQERLRLAPDLVLYDGHGLAHPRRFGIANHLGLLLDVPCIGVAKTRLVGVHGRVPAGKGLWTSLLDQHEVIGAVLRPRAGVKPLVVSIGHRISLETAVRWVMTCVTHHRLPETTRWAHRLASGDVRSGARVPGRARRREQTWATVSRPSRTRRRGAGRGRTPPARR